MFDLQSRYANLETRELETAEGRKIRYVRRRLIPPKSSYLPASRISITDSDRPDLLAYRNLGVPTAFWQMADANEVMHPDELTAEVMRTIVIPIPRRDGGGV